MPRVAVAARAVQLLLERRQRHQHLLEGAGLSYASRYLAMPHVAMPHVLRINICVRM